MQCRLAPAAAGAPGRDAEWRRIASHCKYATIDVAQVLCLQYNRTGRSAETAPSLSPGLCRQSRACGARALAADCWSSGAKLQSLHTPAGAHGILKGHDHVLLPGQADQLAQSASLQEDREDREESSTQATLCVVVHGDRQSDARIWYPDALDMQAAAVHGEEASPLEQAHETPPPACAA